MTNKNSAALLLLTSTLLAGCDQGSMFITSETVPDAVTRVEAAGFDLRLYEFTPGTASHMQCLFVAGQRKAGLVCFPKTPDNEYR